VSTPVLVTCRECGYRFIFIRGTIEKCPKCKSKYKSLWEVLYADKRILSETQRGTEEKKP